MFNLLMFDVFLSKKSNFTDSVSDKTDFLTPNGPSAHTVAFPSLQVLGEYSWLKEDLEPDTVLKLMANLLDLKSTSSETKTWVLLAMAKQCEGGSTDVSVTRKVCETYSSSLDTVLRQRAQELQYLSQDSELQARVLPRDASREPLEVTKACRPAGFQYYVLSD